MSFLGIAHVVYPWKESLAGTVRRAARPGFATIYLCYVHAQLAPRPRSSSWEHQLIQRCDPDFNTKSCAPGTREGSQNLWALLSLSSPPDSFFCKLLLIYLARNLTLNGHQKLRVAFLIHLLLFMFSSDHKSPLRSLSHSRFHVHFWDFLSFIQRGSLNMTKMGLVSTGIGHGCTLSLSNISMTAVCNWLANLRDI